MDVMDYRSLLSDVFNERRSLNPKYSLRAYARDLGIEPAQLSRVLKRTHHISLQSAQIIAPKIYEKKHQQNFFLDVVVFNLARKPAEAAAALKRIKRKMPPPKTMELAWIDVLSDWYHIALIDLIGLANAPTDPGGLAEYLGVSVGEVTNALEQLRKLDLIEKVGDRWRKVSAEMASPSGIPSAAIKKYHKQMLQKSIESIDTQPLNERFIYGRTMTIKKSDVPKIEALTQDYLDQLRLISEEGEPCDSLYQVNIQAFNLKSIKGAVS